MPASVRDVIDTASADYAAAWEMAQKKLVRLIERLMAQGRTADELVRILGATDFGELIGRELGMNQALADMQGAYRSVLASMPGRSPVTEATLGALQSFTRDSFLANANAMPAKLKEEVIKAVLAGGRTSDIAAAIGQTMERYQAETLANTALSTFSRSVEAEMAKGDPPDALYVYEGPVDDRTRDICLAMAAAGELTKAEIDSRYPGAFVDGGGFNCRHSWVPVDAARETDAEGAQAAIDAQGDKWREPRTMREEMSDAA